VAVFPTRRLSFTLDRKLELRVASNIGIHFPQVKRSADAAHAKITEQRRKDWYQLQFFDGDLDHEANWRFVSGGEFAYIAQTRCAVGRSIDMWSMADLVASLIATIKTSHDLLMDFHYWGDVEVEVHLRVEDLKLSVVQDTSPSLFSDSIPVLDISGVQMARFDTVGGIATRTLDFGDRTERLCESLSLLLNDIIRDMGYSVELDFLRDSIARFYGRLTEKQVRPASW
jgi:hypothetical protein